MRKLYVCVILLAVAVASPSYAAVIFGNLGPGDSYNFGTGWTLGNPDYIQGDAFTPGATATLGSIEVAIGILTGDNELDLWLAEDAGGQPGAVIETFHASGAMGSFGEPNALIVFNSLLNPVLIAGQQYWMYASVPGWSAWNWNNTGDSGPHAVRNGAGPWGVGIDIRGAFRVNSTEAGGVPEPGTFVLLGLGLALIGLRRTLK